MTAPNAQLAYRVLDVIDADPKAWDQNFWVKDCGTTFCFAGWALVLTGHSLKPADEGQWLDGYQVAGGEVRDRAARELGIYGDDGGATALALFDGYNTREDLDRLVPEIFGPRPGGEAS